MDLTFQTKSMEERLDIAVSWFFASVNTWIVRPTLPKAENHQSDLVKVQSQAKSLVSGVLGHYSHLVGQRFNPHVLSRDQDVAQMAQEVYTNVQNDNQQTKDKYVARQALLKDACSFLFGGGPGVSMGDYMALVYTLNLTDCREAVAKATNQQDVSGTVRYRLSVTQMMRLHAKVGGSVRLFKRFLGAIYVITGHRISHAPWKEFNAARRELEIPEIHVLENPEGPPLGEYRYVGRYCKLWDLCTQHTMDNRFFLKQYEVRLEKPESNSTDGSRPAPRPVTIQTIHGDSAHATAHSDLTLVTCQYMNGDLWDVQKPHNLDILALDECHESEFFYRVVWEVSIMDSVKCRRAQGMPVACLGASACKFCNHPEEGEWFRNNVSEYEHKGVPVKVHMTDLVVFYVVDKAAQALLLPIRAGQDNTFKRSLRVKDHSWRDVYEGDLERWTLEEMTEAAEAMEAGYETWLQKEKAQHNRYQTRGPASTQAFKDYFDSQDFKNLCAKKGWGTDDHLRYRGFMFDKVTPLKNYLTDTLHANLNI